MLSGSCFLSPTKRDSDGPYLKAKILELTFPCLVADGTIQRVVYQEEFKYQFSGLVEFRGLRMHYHPIFGRGGTGGKKPLLSLHFHYTEPAAAIGSEPLVVAEVRDKDVVSLGSLEDGGTLVRP